jgi:hypothetical protein
MRVATHQAQSLKGGHPMKFRTLRQALFASAVSAALAVTVTPSFAQQPTTGGSSPGMARTPGSEGAAGTAGASGIPPGSAASPAPDEGASAAQSTRHTKHSKHKKHRHHRRHAAGTSEPASATKP